MAKTAAECTGQILSTISTSLLEMAAQALARVSVLEEDNAALKAERDALAAALTTLKADLALATTEFTSV